MNKDYFGLTDSLIKAVEEATKSHTVPKTDKEKKLASLAHPKDKITHKDVMVGRGVVAKEEVEELDELSKSTIGSYIKKASQDKADMANTTGFRAGAKQPVYNTSDESDKEKKRMTGISRAVNKLTKEEVEELDELNKSTLASYAKKASHDARMKMAIGKDFERVGANTRKPEYKAGAKKWEDKYKSDARRREAGTMKAIDRLAKEEVELDEATPTAQQVKQAIGIARDKRYAKGNVTGAVKAMDKVNPGLAQHPAVKKELQKQNEETDTPGNSYEHQCAIHVKHAKLGEGVCLTSQHADPDEEDYIEWYDVMFSDSIERVPSSELEIVVSESHMHAKRKKGKM